MLQTFTYVADDCDAQAEFIDACKPFWPVCKTCGGTGEYETNYGPAGCNLCNSRLVPVMFDGKEILLDYGSEIDVQDGELLAVRQVI